MVLAGRCACLVMTGAPVSFTKAPTHTHRDPFNNLEKRQRAGDEDDGVVCGWHEGMRDCCKLGGSTRNLCAHAPAIDYDAVCVERAHGERTNGTLSISPNKLG